MSSYRVVYCFIAFMVTHAMVNGQNSSIASGNFDIEAVGRSGKIVIIDKATNKAVMTVNPDRIAEVAADGLTEATGHTIESFASTDFTFGAVVTKSRYGLNTTSVTFSTTLTGKPVGVVSVEMIVFHESGTITADSAEKIDVGVGTVKFNIDITNWVFCGTGIEVCKKGSVNQVGTFIDFTIEVKGKEEKTEKPEKSSKQKGDKGAETYEFDDAVFTVSKMVKVDSVWKNMTVNYPKVEQKGKKSSFTFRFPKFTTTVHYDPVFGAEPLTGAGVMLTVGYMYVLVAAFSLVVLGRYA